MAASVKVWINNSPPQCAAEDLNGFEAENNNLILSVGLALDDSDNLQTSAAVAAYAANGDFYADAGAANAYVLNVQTNGAGPSYVAPPSYFLGMRVRFIPANTNSGASTANVAALGVKSIVERDNTPLEGGEIQAGRITELVYNGTNLVLIDNGSDVVSVPTGASILFCGTGTIPDGFLAEDGSAVSRTTYARLFAVIGTTWGVGDGSTTFNLPNSQCRGVIGSGAASGLTSRAVGQAGGAEDAYQTGAQLAPHFHNYTGPLDLTGNAQGGSGQSFYNPAGGDTTLDGGGDAMPIMNPFNVKTWIIKT